MHKYYLVYIYNHGTNYWKSEILPAAGAVSHVSPVNPPTHVQSAPSPSSSAQVPPFWHGFGTQAVEKVWKGKDVWHQQEVKEEK